MFYIAFFSFASHGEESDPELDHVPACSVVEAHDLPEALSKFRQIITAYHVDTDDLNGVARVYLQNVIEVGSLPPEGTVAQWNWRSMDDVWILGWRTYPPKTDYERYSDPDQKLPLLEKLTPAFVVFERDATRHLH